eukprot:gb/GECH01000301.1/.p1 GENE.gb/GECH01000301.1/~~gb/GECH01000301.1/.p1  ORF type:complete len:118 (+),score=47.76 gb/GECH01000301.1/:1-354(+)
MRFCSSVHRWHVLDRVRPPRRLPDAPRLLPPRPRPRPDEVAVDSMDDAEPVCDGVSDGTDGDGDGDGGGEKETEMEHDGDGDEKEEKKRKGKEQNDSDAVGEQRRHILDLAAVFSSL